MHLKYSPLNIETEKIYAVDSVSHHHLHLPLVLGVATYQPLRPLRQVLTFLQGKEAT